MKLLAISNNFPLARFPERGVFVRNALLALARAGAEVDVIAPVSWVSGLKFVRNRPTVVDHRPLRVAQPCFTTLPVRGGVSARLVTSFNDLGFGRAVDRAILADASYRFAYTHFFPSGFAALGALRKRCIPALLSLGESDPWDYDRLYGRDRWFEALQEFFAIVTSSERNREYLLERDPRIEGRVLYVPNGVDTTVFRPAARDESRRILGLPCDGSIAVFCGHFDHRKGPLRVLAALKQAGVRGVFLGGNGPDWPRGPEVLFAGPVPNADLPTWLGAADVFVLPSLSEGMSNAVLEALACGVPLVVSDRRFNEFLKGRDCAILVDPEAPAEIARGIQEALDPTRNRAMRAAGRVLAEQYSAEMRAHRVLAFAEQRLAETGSC